jgi:hypothetical protein
MNPKVKVWVKWMRITQLVLRCLQVICAGGLLAFMIIIRGMDDTTTWCLRIAVSKDNLISSGIMLTICNSPELPFFTPFTQSTTCHGKPLEEPQLLLQVTCYSPRSLMCRFFHFTHIVLCLVGTIKWLKDGAPGRSFFTMKTPNS